MTLNTELLFNKNPAAGGYSISRSLRFSAPDSAFLSRTPASAGNRKTWTWAGWVKRSALGLDQTIFRANNSSIARETIIYFTTSNTIGFYEYSSGFPAFLQTTQVFRDTSAWYHIVAVWDTDNATSGNRMRLYVNGVEVTALATDTQPSLGLESTINTATVHTLGAADASNNLFNGYLADVHFIDGLALGPGYFGEYDTNNVWQPKAFNSGGTTVNDGTDWAANYTGGVNPGLSVNNLWDGSTSTYVNNVWGGTPLEYTLPSVGFATLEVYGSTNGGANNYIKVNGVDVTNQFSSTNGWVTITGISSPFTSITTYTHSSSDYNSIYAVRVDGVVMVRNTTQNLSYGTNGFHLDFADNSSAAALGYDAAGSNDWTVNNLSVTAGAGNDSLVDVPTASGTDTGAGGEVRGNYCLLNALDRSSTGTLGNGNLEWAAGASTRDCIRSTWFFPQSGKWYWEFTVNTTFTGAGTIKIGIANSQQGLNANASGVEAWIYANNGDMYGGGSLAGVNSSFTTGDTIGFAFNRDSDSMTVYKNGTVQSVSFSSIPTTSAWSPFIHLYGVNITGGNVVANFGSRPFAYSAPSGFKALCTTNLPTPTIEDPSTVMDVALYTGNGSTQSISGLGFSPDLVVIKRRSAAENWTWTDVVRGATKTIYSNLTNAEGTDVNGLTAFNSSGFSVGSDTAYNASSSTYAAFCWDGGSSTVTNTDGSISSQVRANASAGFSIVEFTNPSSGGWTFGHGLNAAPKFVIMRPKSVASNWQVYHIGLSAISSGRSFIWLNSTNAEMGSSNTYWTSDPSSTIVSAGSGMNPGSAQSHIAYCFAPVAGYSAFGSYTGNGSTDGTFVYTGFRPRWVLSKRTDQAGWSWLLWDSARDPINQVFNYLRPDLSNAETPATNNAIDFLSNGFKMRQTDGNTNGSGGTFVWAAFAEHPFQTARAR